MRVYWDLFGVLCAVYHTDWETWEELVVDAVPPKDILNFPPTEYLEVALKTTQHTLRVLSICPEPWKPYVAEWMSKWVGTSKHYKLEFYDKPYEKIKRMWEEKSVIIEDYPKFRGYKRVVLVRRKYNEKIRDSSCFGTARTPKELYEIIKAAKKRKR